MGLWIRIEQQTVSREKICGKRTLRQSFSMGVLLQIPSGCSLCNPCLCHYHKAYTDDQNLTRNIETLSDDLLDYFVNTRSGDWRWFEPYLTYVNGRLPQALFEAYRETKQARYIRVAEESLKFLLEVQIINKQFVPIGNCGWYKERRTTVLLRSAIGGSSFNDGGSTVSLPGNR